jgi:GNAT superfamily N-acetyltransferase
MTHGTFTHRLARRDDLNALRALMDAAISELQKPFLDESQIASSRTIMGLDTQLIDDGTYFIVDADGKLAGCGGWSRRATLYGGDQSPGRSAVLLDPAKDAARIRAMYTHPHHTRKGVGRLIPLPLRGGSEGRRIRESGADGHHGRRAALPRLRL